MSPGRSQLVRETTMALAGYPTGEFFEQLCAGDRLVSGVNLTWDGTHLTSMASVCKTAAGTTSTTPAVGAILGNAANLACNASEVAVGMYGAFTDFPQTSTKVLAHAALYCADRNTWANLPPQSQGEGAIAHARVAGYVGSAQDDSAVGFTRVCPTGMAIKGFVGGAGTRVDRLQLKCQRIDRSVDIARRRGPAAGATVASASRFVDLCAGYGAMVGIYASASTRTNTNTANALLERLGGLCETVSWDNAARLRRAGQTHLLNNGGGGNNQDNAFYYEESCPATSALVGLRVRVSNGLLANVSGRCAATDAWSDPNQPPITLTVLPDVVTTTGTDTIVDCARGEYLAGLYMETSQNKLNQVAPYCRRFSPDPDTTRPTATLLYPPPGAVLRGTVPVQASATDNVGVTYTDLYVDDDWVGGAAGGSFNYSWTPTWDSIHLLEVVAYDSAGNEGWSGRVYVTVDNTPPSASISSPTNGSTVSGTVTVNATASDATSGIGSVRFYLDGTNKATDSSPPFSWTWDSSASSSGSHTLGVEVTDMLGNTSSRSSITVTVSNAARSPSPATGATGVSTTTALSWTAGAGATSHDVYFGTSSTPTFKVNQTKTSYSPGTLSANTKYYWRIDERSSAGTTTGTVWSFTTASSSVPPGLASAPNPANNATVVATSITLSWTASSGATSHDVYFGTSSTPTFKVNQTGTTYNPGTLTTNTKYYWRINEKNSVGTTTGTLWSFTTASGGVPPGAAAAPSPANSATSVATSTTLTWTAGSGATSHDVYLGTSSTPTFKVNQTGTTYNPGTFAGNTKYYWRIDEKNSSGTTTGTVWNFTTAATTTLLSDDFDSGGTSQWTASDGTWAIVTDGSKAYQQSNTSNNARSSAGLSTWTAQTVIARVKPVSFNGTDRFVSVLARFKDKSNYYFVALRSSGKVELKKLVNGSSTALATITMTISTGTWYTVKLSAIGSTISASVNGTSVGSVTDSTFTAGKAGLGTYYAKASFDHVIVTK
jgi:hypothetical protein